MSRDLTISPAAYAALEYPHAGVAELADAPALGAGAGNGLGVRVPPPAFIHPRPLALGADERVEELDAGPVRDGDVARVGLRPADPQTLAVLAEQAADVGGPVGEEVARIGVLRGAAARQLRLEAVHGAAAVGVDQAAEEGLGSPVEDHHLPGP